MGLLQSCNDWCLSKWSNAELYSSDEVGTRGAFAVCACLFCRDAAKVFHFLSLISCLAILALRSSSKSVWWPILIFFPSRTASQPSSNGAWRNRSSDRVGPDTNISAHLSSPTHESAISSGPVALSRSSSIGSLLKRARLFLIDA